MAQTKSVSNPDIRPSLLVYDNVEILLDDFNREIVIEFATVSP
jgi:hypothetical protein